MSETEHGSRIADAAIFALALALAALAGFVDAAGFIAFGGLFVSFMAGDGTKAAIHATDDLCAAIAPVRTILAFVAGVVVGELIGAAAGLWGRVVVLGVEAGLLWIAVAAAWAGAGDATVTLVLGFAMGAQNASVHHAEGIDVALTYVTGTVVHIGRAIARALRGDGEWRAAAPFSAMWAALLLGGLAGGFGAHRSIHGTLTVAATAATVLTVLAIGLPRAAALQHPA